MWTLGPEEMVAIFILALLLFGPKELPKLGKTIGKAMTEFRRAQTELKTTFDREMRNLERETGIKELTATAFQTDTYNYDNSAYDGSYYDGTYDSTLTYPSANGASATQGAGSTTALQIEAAAGKGAAQAQELPGHCALVEGDKLDFGEKRRHQLGFQFTDDPGESRLRPR